MQREGDEEFFCPVCSDRTDHAIIARGRNPVGRCFECGDVHPVVFGERQKTVHVRAVVSDGPSSRICTVEMDDGEVCRIGDTFVAACGEEYTGVEVTSIESGGLRVKHALAGDISTLWTRKVEEVALRVAIHMGGTTTPLRVMVPGDDIFSVGEVYTLGKRKFRISRIKVRDGGMLRKPGQKAEAKRIRRVFGHPA
jgi:uncharacterized Zn finger protein